jgi:hypothetical protein
LGVRKTWREARSRRASQVTRGRLGALSSSPAAVEVMTFAYRSQSKTFTVSLLIDAPRESLVVNGREILADGRSSS